MTRPTLTSAQAAAVASKAKRRVLIAGAGCGKTTTLVEIIADLVEGRGREPECITALSFTRNAAVELRERVQARLPGCHGMTFGTSHALALAIVRSGFRHLDLPERIVVYDEQDEADVLRASATAFSVTQKATKTALAAIRTGAAGAEHPPKALDAAREYEARLRRAGAIDFASILRLAVRVLREVPSIRAQWSWRARYLIVDEYHDTAPEEAELYAGLEPKETVVVGDPLQEIYAFRGTSREFLLRAMGQPETSVSYLVQSFRSGPAIVDAANALTATAPGAPAERLRPHPDVEASVGLAIGSAAWIDEAKHHLAAGRTVAVLARTNHAAEQAAQALALGPGAPTSPLTTERPFYALEEVRSFHAALRLRFNPLDVIATRLVVAAFMPDEPSERREWAARQANATDRPVIEFLGWTGMDQAEDVVQFATWAEEQLVARYSAEGRTSRAANVRTAANRVREWAAAAGTGTPALVDCLDWLAGREFSALRKARAGDRSIDIGTIHAAKGLEWDVVFLVAFDEGVLPHKSADLEEERRLAYVGITRARERLVIVAGCGGEKPSPFVAEMFPAGFPQAVEASPIAGAAEWNP